MTFSEDALKGPLLISSFSYDDPFARAPLLVDLILSSKQRQNTFESLVDTDVTEYTFIDETKAQIVCDNLRIEPIPLSKPRPIKGFDDKLTRQLITHMINSSFIVQDHTESLCPMLITKLSNHPIIIGKSWMNKHGVILNMMYDKLIFVPDRCSHWGAPQTELNCNSIPPIKSPSSIRASIDPSPSPTVGQGFKSIPKYKILKRESILYPSSNVATKGTQSTRSARPTERPAKIDSKSSDKRQEFLNIAPIGAEAYHQWAGDWGKKQGAKCFAMTMYDINAALKASHPDVTQINETSESMSDVLSKLPSEYHDFQDVFDRSKADELPSHRPYNHKIIIEGEGQLPRSRIYLMSGNKLQKVKEYLEENLKKGFISPSSAPYASPALFVVKSNESLRFCVNYRKLNAVTKRNRYSIPLIEETLARVTGCKYLTKLNIIAAFNKLRMHPDSEDYITFVTFMSVYKYHVLSFNLINEPFNYQHYMNDVLFEYLNQFCQTYLDDIFIYSKTKKEHVRHVRLILIKLRAAGLQMNIEKCEFHVQETAFLEILLSIDEIRTDLRKI